MEHVKAMAIGAAVALAAGGSLAATSLLSPAAASTHVARTSHALEFTAVRGSQLRFGKRDFGEQGRAVQEGKEIGFYSLSLHFGHRSGSGSFSLDLKGGHLYGTLHVTNGPDSSGRITGGLGTFKGATGTLKAHNENRSGSRTDVTITYSE